MPLNKETKPIIIELFIIHFHININRLFFILYFCERVAKKLWLEPFYPTCGKQKVFSGKAAVKEMNDVDRQKTVNELIVKKWFRRFKESDTILEDKPKSERPSVVEDDAFIWFGSTTAKHKHLYIVGKIKSKQELGVSSWRNG